MRLPLAVLVPALAVAVAAPLARGQARPAAPPPAPLVVMNLAAHPDDEDGLTLAYYRHARNAVAYSVLFTRGEGGQNEIGPALYERLGAVRTAETERAARLLGTQVHYLNLYDFGFSKHAAEAFREWSRPRRGFWDTGAAPVSAEAGRDAVTARLVRLIRTLKPDVLFTNHDTTTAWPDAQHGHHQAVGRAAYDAVALAADPAYHPEQLAEPGVAVWQVQRLFLRQFRPTGTHDAAVPVGDPCTPAESCAERAVRAVAEHASQGFDKFAARFLRDTTYFTLLRAAPGAPPLPAGATDLAAGLAPNPHAARVGVAYLLDSGRLLDGVALAEAAGAPLPTRVAVPGQTLAGGHRIPPEAPYTWPAHRFMYDHATSLQPVQVRETTGATTSTATGTAAGTAAGGAERVPVEVAPPVVVDLAPSPVRLVHGENVLPVAVRTYDPAAREARVTLRIEGVPAEGGAGEVLYAHTQALAPSDTAVTFSFLLPRSVEPGAMRVVVEAEAAPTSAPAAPFVETRPAALLPAVRVADGLRVGFVRSYDRVTEDALRAMGADVVVLDSAALAAGAFDSLHTVVLDIRAYLVRPDLRRHNDRLLAWVRRGGHLVVGYHKSFEWNPPADGAAAGPFGEVVDVPPGGFAPFPLVLGRERVVEEDAPVALLDPGHVLFRAPHAIGPADWAGWVQERGLYFPQTYDARYAELLATGDTGEAPLRGGLPLAPVGEGTYLYSPLVWYRQLEALHAGAWRLFANLVSLPLTDGR